MLPELNCQTKNNKNKKEITFNMVEKPRNFKFVPNWALLRKTFHSFCPLQAFSDPSFLVPILDRNEFVCLIIDENNVLNICSGILHSHIISIVITLTKQSIFYEYPTGNRLVLEVIILKMMSGKYYMYIKDLTLAGTLEQGQMSSADKVSEGR